MPAKERLIEVGFDPALGARPLRRAVQHEVEDRLSEQILHGELNAGDHVHVDFVDGEFVFEHGAARRCRSAVGVEHGAAIGTGPSAPTSRPPRASSHDDDTKSGCTRHPLFVVRGRADRAARGVRPPPPSRTMIG